jgi:regulatory protein
MAFRPKRQILGPESVASLQSARRTAVGLLARRDFATGELREKLREQGYDSEVADEAVRELLEGRVLSDERYAENYVRHHAERGQGPLRIAADLRARGVTEDLIDAALQGGPDWRALAREVRIRKFGLNQPSDWKERARQARFLQYRGFSSDHIASALGTRGDPD